MNKLFKKTPIWQLIAVYLAVNVLNVLLVLPIRHYWGITQDVSDELMRAFMFIGMLFWFILLMFKNKTGLSPELKNIKRDIRPKEWIAVLIFNYAISLTIIFVLILGVSAMTASSMDGVADASRGTAVTSYAATLINFIAASFIVPIAEEFMFRGVLLNRLRGKVNIVAAVVISSLLFGMTHLALSSLGATVFGICMCAVYLRTKNIAVPIVMHITHNLILCIVESKGVLWGTSTTGGIGSMELTTAMTIGGTVIFGMIALLCGIYLSRTYHFFNFEQYQSKQIENTDS